MNAIEPAAVLREPAVVRRWWALLSAVLPPLALILAVAPAWLLRAWMAVAGHVPLGVNFLSAKGFLWDLAVVWLALALLAALARMGSLFRWLAVAVAAAFGCAATGVRALDLAHLRAYGEHVQPESALWLAGGIAPLLAEPWAQQVAAVAVVGGAAFGLAVHLGRSPHWVAVPSASLVALVPPLLLTGLAVRDQVLWPPAPHEPRMLPEVHAARMWHAWGSEVAERRKTPLPAIAPAAWKRLADAGLVPAANRPDGAWPLFQPRLPESSLPLRKGAVAQPNVAIVLVESWNRVFLDAVSGQYRGLMPELAGVVPRVTAVDGFGNTTSPTLPGLVASLCGVLWPQHPSDATEQDSLAHKVAFDCLPDVLRQRGYRTSFVQGADLRMYGTDGFVAQHGFEARAGEREILAVLPNAEKGSMGLHDHSVVDYAEREIARLETLRSADGRPWLLVVMTLDTHDPGMAPAECTASAALSPLAQAATPIAAARKALAAYHCSDRDLGRLARTLLRPGLGDRTLWLMTGDHAAFRGPALDPLVGGHTLTWSFDRLPLLVHDPRHDLPHRIDALAGSHDLAPTVLHLLGLHGQPTSMGGRSIFGSRAQVPFVAGRVGKRLAFVRNPAGARELTFDALAKACKAGERLIGGGFEPATACDLQQWFAWHDRVWELHRLRPRQFVPVPRP
jgi:hypothetical protein